MLVIFAPTVVTGVRDGMIFGALGGFGFNIAESAIYTMRVSFLQPSLDGLPEQLVHLGYGGIEDHVIWSALVGAGIGLAVQTDKRWLKIVAPLCAYLFAVFTHTVLDNQVDSSIIIGLTAIVLLLQECDLNMPNLQDQVALEEIANSYGFIIAPIEILVINLDLGLRAVEKRELGTAGRQ